MAKTLIYRHLCLTIIFVSLFIFFAGSSVVFGQAIYTPTADLEGNIFYTVGEGESCLSISMLTKVDVADIISLNRLDENCTITAGTRILIGTYHTPTPTPGPSPTPVPVTPTPTAYAGNAEVCVYLYQDVNGNAKAEETEAGIGGGAVSVTKRDGTENFSGLTTGYEQLCFPAVPEGEYNVSVAPPDTYNATTNMNYAITIRAGDAIQVNFGAQKQAAFEDQITGQKQGPKRSPIMAILGVALILAGLAIVIIFGVIKRRED